MFEWGEIRGDHNLLKMKFKKISTPPNRAPLKRGIKDWEKSSLYPYWEIPKNKKLNERARFFRKRGVLSEVLFWKALKNKKEIGFDIDRQIIIGNYIVDFFIPELGLVFEIDGESHSNKELYDKERDIFMQELNLKVVRVSDLDVKNNLSEVYKYILKIIKERERFLKFPS